MISSSIMGVGATNKLSAVRWGIARKIVGAWVLTIPAAALIGVFLLSIHKIIAYNSFMEGFIRVMGESRFYRLWILFSASNLVRTAYNPMQFTFFRPL